MQRGPPRPTRTDNLVPYPTLFRSERLEPYEIGRALFHLNQRRGFLSNRKAERRQKDSEDGKIASGAKALDQAMAEAGADTLGQFLNGRDAKRVRLDGDSQSYDFYPHRRPLASIGRDAGRGRGVA